jgi:hyperosmotically inducible protein
MKSNISSIVRGTLVGMLALALASCEQRPSAEKVGREIDRAVDSAVDKAGNEIGKVADAADRKIELAKSTITGTAADAAKVVVDKTAQTAESVAVKTAATAKAVDELAVGSKVKVALTTEPGVKIAAIQIDGGTVKLFGTVDSSAMRDKASQIATGIDGVKSVNNYLVVVPKGS